MIEVGWGILNNVLPLVYWPKVAIGVAVLDIAIYLQHVMFHGLPTLWRLHMMHHSDLDFDVTTGIRFHPIEILLSMGIKMIGGFFVGISALGVLIFEVLLNATSLFNHGNVRLAASIYNPPMSTKPKKIVNKENPVKNQEMCFLPVFVVFSMVIGISIFFYA